MERIELLGEEFVACRFDRATALGVRLARLRDGDVAVGDRRRFDLYLERRLQLGELRRLRLHSLAEAAVEAEMEQVPGRPAILSVARPQPGLAQPLHRVAREQARVTLVDRLDLER